MLFKNFSQKTKEIFSFFEKNDGLVVLKVETTEEGEVCIRSYLLPLMLSLENNDKREDIADIVQECSDVIHVRLNSQIYILEHLDLDKLKDKLKDAAASS